jgi:hypothetical protein
MKSFYGKYKIRFSNFPHHHLEKLKKEISAFKIIEHSGEDLLIEGITYPVKSEKPPNETIALGNFKDSLEIQGFHPQFLSFEIKELKSYLFYKVLVEIASPPVPPEIEEYCLKEDMKYFEEYVQEKIKKEIKKENFNVSGTLAFRIDPQESKEENSPGTPRLPLKFTRPPNLN